MLSPYNLPILVIFATNHQTNSYYTTLKTIGGDKGAETVVSAVQIFVVAESPMGGGI